MTAYIAYLRVSTQKQGASGLGLDAQTSAIAQYVANTNGSLVVAYTEVESGKNCQRPTFAKALAHAKAIKATLIVAKLDRLGRDVQFISTLMNAGVDFVACDNPTASRLTLHILAAVAENEALMISQRTKVALAAAKARGTKLGGFRGVAMKEGVSALGRAASAKTRTDNANARATDTLRLIEALKLSGFTSYAQLATGLSEQGSTSPRGKGWTPSAVRLEIMRAAA
jgi:DNA invertase Pin-like site-specific DNA recombinase